MSLVGFSDVERHWSSIVLSVSLLPPMTNHNALLDISPYDCTHYWQKSLLQFLIYVCMY
jgi:hypothetical protein